MTSRRARCSSAGPIRRGLVAAALGLVLALAAGAAVAAELSLDGDLVQGGLVLGRTAPGAEVRLDGRAVRVAPDGRFVIGFGRDFPAQARLEVALPDGTVVRRELAIAARDYEVQRIDGLPEHMVTPPDDVVARIQAEAALIAKARANDHPEALFRSGFVWPALGTVTGVFGSQRILNGKPRQPHYGIDIAAPEGAQVRAPADGVVTLAHPDLYFTGGTVLLDHGHGLTSVYSHLKEISVSEGERLRQGQVLGAVGATGRATGAHLDWRVNWFEERLDPALLVPPMPASEGEQDAAAPPAAEPD